MNSFQAYDELKAILAQGKLAGSWLIQGPYGVGKTDLIQKFCSFLLTGNENSEFSVHPDLKWIEKDYTEEEKRDIIRTLQAGKELDEDIKRERKEEITIDDIRKGIQFLSLTSSQNRWRVLVIDTADDMNENAANALLKLLEEPPTGSVIFLLSHNPGKLLPTIRSRCRNIYINPLSKEEMKSFILGDYPEDQDINVLIELSCGSIGKYYKLKELDGLSYYQEIIHLLQEIPLNKVALLNFAEKVSKESTIYNLVTDILTFIIMKRIKEKAQKHENIDEYIDLWDHMLQRLKDTKTLYLDKKNVLVSLITQLGRLQ